MWRALTRARSSKNARYKGINAKEYYQIKAELADAPLFLKILDCLMKRRGKKFYGDGPYPARPMSPVEKAANEAQLWRLLWELEDRRTLRTAAARRERDFYRLQKNCAKRIQQ